MAIKYKDLLPVANGLIIAGTFFSLGLLFGNLPYDARTLFTNNATDEAFKNSLRHYQTWADIPKFALWFIHFFIGLGFIGCFIRMYKPSEDSKYFDYGALFLYVVASCIYLTNLHTGAQSARAGEWGEVDQNTGINVIAASSAMTAFVLGGVVMLQIGLYYGEWEYQQRLEEFHEEEEKAAAATAAAVGSSAQEEKSGKKTVKKAEAEIEEVPKATQKKQTIKKRRS